MIVDSQNTRYRQGFGRIGRDSFVLEVMPLEDRWLDAVRHMKRVNMVLTTLLEVLFDTGCSAV